MRLAVVIVLAAALGGCSRSYYRRDADRETYGAVVEHARCPAWALPPYSIDPPPPARFFDPYDPDHPPLPPDDPAAHRYMHCANGMHGYRHWHRDGDAPWIEDPAWREGLVPDTKEGEVTLTPERSVELGLLHSREYQTQRENVYFSALALTLNRYEFALHYFATNDTNFTHFGSGADELNTLTTSSTLGFTKAFAAGGQLMAEFANSFVFQFAGPDQVTTQSNIIVNFMQPLLRHFGRQVRMEALTEAERSLLYSIRTFARFRKQFSFQVYTQQYLQLLLQVQSIRNLEQNLVSLRENLRLHEALLATGTISTVELDQVFQSYQSGRLSLLSARANLETNLDNFKILLGLPPDVPVKLDDSLLTPFQFNDPALTVLQDEIDKLLAEYRGLDQAPALPELRAGFGRIREFHRRTVQFVDQVGGEIKRWRQLPAGADEDVDQIERARLAQRVLSARLGELGAELLAFGKTVDRSLAELAEGKRQEGWELLQRRIRQQGSLTGQLFVIQTQVRVYLVKLQPQKIRLAEAVAYAEDNRLDLMNQRGQVVDAWRQIAVTANALRGEFDVNFMMNLATKPGGVNPFDFRSSASSYTVGVHLEAPLDREAARNVYRGSQITYEQTRRTFMALEDTIQEQIRRDLRALETERLNFEIIRQSLITAARAVESSQDRLLVVENAADTTVTQNILNSLNTLLSTKQQLISSWVNYETTRIQLLLDMEKLQVDDRGLYLNESNDQSDPPADARLPEPTADGDRVP